MTPQEIFDTVYTKLMAQGCPAKNERGGCHYLHRETGHRCAVGVLFNEDELKAYGDYSSGIEALIEDDQGQGIGRLRPMFYQNIEFLSSLQNLHDGCPPDPAIFAELFPKRMKEFAAFRGLSTAVIDNHA